MNIKINKVTKTIIDTKLRLEFFEKMHLVRKFEYNVLKLLREGVVLGSVHLDIGEEAVKVGTIMPLADSDYLIPTHRGHGQHLIKGTDPGRLLAELSGKVTGLCKGRAGSVHIFDKEHNDLGVTAIVGAQLPISVGVGMAIKYKKGNSCVMCNFGDGTTNQGWFYEALNLASLWELPIIFTCDNNFYGMGTPYDRTSNAKIHEKAELFHIRSETVDGNDVEAVYTQTKEIVDWVKSEKKPALIECYTYRWIGHSAFDTRPYRPKKEIEAWKERCPIKKLKNKLLQEGVIEKTLDDIEKKVTILIEKAEKFAVESAFPEFDDSMLM